MTNPQPDRFRNWIRFLFTKRLTPSLFIILPAVFGLTAFASGFVALTIVEHFLVTGTTTSRPVKEAMSYIRIEVMGFSLLGVVAGLVVAYAVLNPLKRMVRGARQAAIGEWTEAEKIKGLEGFGQVGHEFHQAMSSLKQNLVDSMAWGWVLMSKSGTIASLNPGAELILGVRAKELIGQPFEALSRSIQMEGDFLPLVNQALKKQTVVTGRQFSIVTQDQKRVKLSFTTTLLTDSDGASLGVAITFKDLTRSGEITEQMQRTDKLAAMGTLAACLAHEVRNPLGAIKGLAELLDEAFEEGNPHRTYTQTMIKEIDRLNGVVSNLLEFANPDTDKAGPCNLNELVAQALTLANVTSKDIQSEQQLANDLPPVWGEKRQLVQVLLNLLQNAGQAVKSPGLIRISTHRLVSRDNSEEHVQVRVANSGPALDPAVQSRMFDPFFTTKKDGTGLGLAITSQIVNAHRGAIYVEHENGLTAFCVELPVKPKATVETSSSHNPQEVMS